MIKYKVKDIANDLGVQNKKITEILEKYCGVTKKTMMSLTESEIDVIIDVVTRENSVQNFDKYFEARNAKLDKPEPEKKAAKTEGKADARDKKADKPEEKTEDKPAQSKQRKRKVIDTRQTNVDVERYNSKYDDLASDTSKSRSTDRDHTTKKQKFSNRTQKQRGRRQGKRETEAERLKRIAMERKQKPITVEIPDEITVNELALRLKATVAEVVKK
ncbi:MAG: translation initiation factor IF-2 N-terminal domain-containing protein, partial [Ruminococcus sp.]|nr:translation initiation factor IF-2 N-terminal domain-containing protein [Ruminococcus sp.]